MAHTRITPQYIYVKPVAGHEIRKSVQSNLYSLWIGNEKCILEQIPSERIAQALGAALIDTTGTLQERIQAARTKVGW